MTPTMRLLRLCLTLRFLLLFYNRHICEGACLLSEFLPHLWTIDSVKNYFLAFTTCAAHDVETVAIRHRNHLCSERFSRCWRGLYKEPTEKTETGQKDCFAIALFLDTILPLGDKDWTRGSDCRTQGSQLNSRCRACRKTELPRPCYKDARPTGYNVLLAFFEAQHMEQVRRHDPLNTRWYQLKTTLVSIRWCS